jgi:hypothetical protein
MVKAKLIGFGCSIILLCTFAHEISASNNDFIREPIPLPSKLMSGSYISIWHSSDRDYSHSQFRFEVRDSIVTGVWVYEGSISGITHNGSVNLRVITFESNDTLTIIGQCYRVSGILRNFRTGGQTVDSLMRWIEFSGTVTGPNSDYPLGKVLVVTQDRKK